MSATFSRFALFALLAASIGAASGQVVPLPTSDAALVGRFARGPVNWPITVGATEFTTRFGSANPAGWPAEIQARQFFANGGQTLRIARAAGDGPLAAALVGSATDLTGLHAVAPLSDLRILLAPEISQLPTIEFAATLASFRAFLEPRRIFFLLDPPAGLATAADALNWAAASVPADAAFCATYFPYLSVLLDGAPVTVGASGAMAAIYARSDADDGPWRSPSGTGWPLQAQGLVPLLSTAQSDSLTAQNVNAIRQFTGVGIVPWGARTLDRTNADNRFISVVRTRQWIAACLERALAFAAIEDNAAPLWSQIRSLADAFLLAPYQQGAFAGSTPSEAFFVRCDATTTSAADIAAHRVRLLYGVALLRAGEFDLTQLTAPTYDSARPAPAAALHLRKIEGELQLAYPTVAGFDFVLQSRADLQAGDWMDGPPVRGDGAWRTEGEAFSGDRGFRRLRITPAR